MGQLPKPRIAIIYYSTFGHVAKMARAVQQGVQSAGGTANLYQIPETLSQDELHSLKAPPKEAGIPFASPQTLLEYDAYLFGIPTAFGNFGAQWKRFWDSTGELWVDKMLYHKFAGVFVSTGTPGGGQEATIMNSLSVLAHHGIVYVPLGYGAAEKQLTSFAEIHGSSPWGAGCFAGATAERNPSSLELEIAAIQGKEFYSLVSRLS